MTWNHAEIIKIVPFTNTIIQVYLKTKHYIPYQAGQYLELRAGVESNFFSIANAPLGQDFYELHIRHDKSISSQNLLKHIENHQSIEIRLPFGQTDFAHLKPQRPILFVAGGTGFAPIKAIIEKLLFQDDPRLFELYWGAQDMSDLYWQSHLKEWQHDVKTFSYLSLSTGQKSYNMFDELLARHQDTLKDKQVLISGAFEMVYKGRDLLLAQGMKKDFIYSDAFDFESTPR